MSKLFSKGDRVVLHYDANMGAAAGAVATVKKVDDTYIYVEWDREINDLSKAQQNGAYYGKNFALLAPKPKRKTDFEAALDYTLDEVRKVMIDRHAKYGPGNILRHGEYGVVVRLGDKYERLDNSRQLDFADESTDDTVLDIIGYGLIMKMLRAKAWPGQ